MEKLFNSSITNVQIIRVEYLVNYQFRSSDAISYCNDTPDECHVSREAFSKISFISKDMLNLKMLSTHNDRSSV